MDVRTYSLGSTQGMVGGLAADPANDCLWLGLAGMPGMVARFRMDRREVELEPLGDLVTGYSYVHRSVVPAPDGHVYVGLTWLMGIRPGGDRPVPFKPGGFSAVLTVMKWMGRLLSSTRIVRRMPDGRWTVYREGRYMSADLIWDSLGVRLLRLTPKGLMHVTSEGETLVAPSLGGFVHQAAVGAQGQTLTCDEEGILSLREQGGRLTRLGDLQDGEGAAKAAPGVDAVARVGEHFLVGGTRNRARPFVVDLRGPTLTVLSPLPTAPRLSAIAVSPTGQVTLAAGVGRVGLYRLDPASLQVTALTTVESDQGPMHHAHDMVAWPDGRLFLGEFYPLDVPQPPWPDRPCRLWEVSPER